MTATEGLIIANHWQLVNRLGCGGFGEVWLAYDLLGEIHVAIKFYSKMDSGGLEEFRTEFKTAYRFQHPNLLRIDHLDVYDNIPYLVMPYCSNGAVSKYAGNVDEKSVWRFLYDVSSGLSYMHTQYPPVIHQDIKLENILISDTGNFVITDFGISNKLRSSMSRNSTGNSNSGTVAYMAPERFSSHPRVAKASDIWSLGMSAYELVTGYPMWDGMGGCAQVNGAHIAELPVGYSKQLGRVIKSCLALKMDDRPSAMELNRIAKSTLDGNTDSYKVKQPKTWCARNIILACGAMFALLLLIFVGYTIIGDVIEQKAFDNCRTIEQCEMFLNDYPESSYCETVRKRLARMKKKIVSVSQNDDPSEIEPNVVQTHNVVKQPYVVTQEVVLIGNTAEEDSVLPAILEKDTSALYPKTEEPVFIEQPHQYPGVKSGISRSRIGGRSFPHGPSWHGGWHPSHGGRFGRHR